MSAKKIANFITVSAVILGALILTAAVEASHQPNSVAVKYFRVFVAHFDPTMTYESYSTFIGGTGDDFGIGLATARLANSTTNYTFVGGCTSSTDFPKTTGRTATGQTGFLTLISETNISKLAIVGAPPKTAAGATIPDIQVQDANGVLVADATNAVTIALGSNPSNGKLSGTTTVNAVGGMATFSGLSIDKPGSGYTFVATSTSPALTSAPSAPFNIFQPVLVFSAQPVSTLAGAAIPAVKVAIQDGSGNTLNTAANAVTLSIGSNPGGGTLGGTTTVTIVIGNNVGGGTLTGTLSAATVNGVATFSDLRIDRIGNGYTLVASAAGIGSATSAPFNITPAQIPFANFSCGKIESSGGHDDEENQFHLTCDFTLAAGSRGISPATTDAFKLTVGAATISLPAGSFRSDGERQTGPFSFESKDKKGMDLEIHIEPEAELKKGPTYHLEVEAEGVNLGSIPKDTQTVTVTLMIGNNTGTTSVKVNGKRDD